MKHKPCDFCNNSATNTSTYYYASFCGYGLIKVRLCKECAEKEKKHIRAKMERGKIEWMPEIT